MVTKKTVKSKNKWILFSGMGVVLIILDQLVKHFLRTVNIDYGFFALTPTRNTGISFGLFQGSSTLIIIISIIVLFFIWYFRKEFEKNEIFITLIASGIIGNLIDRIFNGYVFDFFNLKWWPVFNLADAMIFVSVVGFIIATIIHEFKKDSDNKKHVKNN